MSVSSTVIVIKSIGTVRYEVELLQLPNHKYQIRYENKTYHESYSSEEVVDFNLVSLLFDLKVQDLEGI